MILLNGIANVQQFGHLIVTGEQTTDIKQKRCLVCSRFTIVKIDRLLFILCLPFFV